MAKEAIKVKPDKSGILLFLARPLRWLVKSAAGGAEEELRMSEERLRLLTDNASDMIIRIQLSPTFKTDYVSPSSRRMTGYAPEEFYADPELGLKIIHPEDRKLFMEYASLKASGNRPTTVRLVRKDGTVIWAEQTFTTIYDKGGKPVAIHVISRDVTERKLMEEEIQAEQNKLQSLIGAMEYTLTIQDKDFNIIYQNEPSKMASGGDHIGEKCYSVYEGREAVCEGCPVAKAFKDGKSHTSDRQRLEPSGEITLWENTANPIRDAEGNIVSCLELARDITDRKKAEQALSDEATRRRILVDESGDGIVVLDEQGNVYEANQKFADMLGYTPEEVRKLSVWDWDAQIKREQLDEMIASIGPEGDRFETRHRRKDGSIFDVEISTNGAVFAGRKLIFCVCRDITARKQAEEALRESEEKFYKAFRSHPTAVALSTMKDGKFLEVNEAFLRNYGYSREEVIGHSSKELGLWVNPKDRVRILRVMREKGQVLNEEFKARKKSGEIRTMTFSAEPIDIADERCIIASTDDITERKQIEEALRESEEKYKTLTEDAPIGIYFNDFGGKFLFGNKKAEEIVGYKREDLLGKSFLKLKLLDPKDIGRAIKLLGLNKLGKATGPDRFVLNRKDGTKTVVEIRTRITTVGGKKLVLGMVEDITEREKAESTLRSQRELIDQIIATTPNAVMVIDKDMEVLLANDTFYKQFGLRKASVENKPIYEVIKDEELKQALSDTIKNNKKSLSLEFRYRLKDMPRIFIATIARMQSNRYLILLSDVTEEREKQERLYLTDRLASVGEMASGVAHELNNPLTSIIGLSNLLAKQDMPTENKEDIVAINAEAQRCAAIVKNLLSFARKHAPKREPLQVARIVEDVLKLRAYEHRSLNITVETDLPDDLPEVMADYFQLQQVLLNIILNAETAMVDTNGQGTLRITGERTDGYVRISFSDDGPGIAKENVGLIFNPFFTTKEVGQGTGLGLSICYGIVAAHGGKIYAKNNSDKGTTFFVELPVIGD